MRRVIIAGRKPTAVRSDHHRSAVATPPRCSLAPDRTAALAFVSAQVLYHSPDTLVTMARFALSCALLALMAITATALELEAPWTGSRGLLGCNKARISTCSYSGGCGSSGVYRVRISKSWRRRRTHGHGVISSGSVRFRRGAAR